jgi:hypothetical protein
MRQLRGQRYSPDCQRIANVIHTSAETKKLDNVLWSAISCRQENRRVACVCQSSAGDKFRLVQTWRHHKGYIGQSHGYLPPRRRPSHKSTPRRLHQKSQTNARWKLKCFHILKPQFRFSRFPLPCFSPVRAQHSAGIANTLACDETCDCVAARTGYRNGTAST